MEEKIFGFVASVSINWSIIYEVLPRSLINLLSNEQIIIIIITIIIMIIIIIITIIMGEVRHTTYQDLWNLLCISLIIDMKKQRKKIKVV